MTTPMSRRALLGRGLVAGAGALALATTPGRRLAGMPTARAATQRFAAALPIPEYLVDADITLRAVAADVPILDGPPTRMWTFNGTFPGPVIKRPAGQTTRVTVHHELPNEAGSLTIHNHGNHSRPSEDGQPGIHAIQPGASRTYTYELMEDGAPERGAFQWYHDHSHHRTGRNTWMGLVGGFIIDDGVDRSLGLPDGEFDIPLIVAERSFDQDNQLVDGFTAPDRENRTVLESIGEGHPPFDEVPGLGQVVLVNGVPEPYLDVAARRYRLRILNASNFRPYNFSFTNGMPFTQVATESGLLPAPVEHTELLLGPAERAEIIVDFSALAHSTVELESRMQTSESGVPSVVPATPPAIAPIMRFHVGAVAQDPSVIPAQLRPLPDWAESLSPVPDRVWAFGLGTDEAGRPAWTINGRTFDHQRVDARPVLGSSETWMLANTTSVGISHYIHIHDIDWLMLSRNGQPPLAHEAGLKETFRLDPGEVVVVGSKFTDHLGHYMLHCHMLEHEDHGMMAGFEVVSPD